MPGLPFVLQGPRARQLSQQRRDADDGCGDDYQDDAGEGDQRGAANDEGGAGDKGDAGCDEGDAGDRGDAGCGQRGGGDNDGGVGDRGSAGSGQGGRIATTKGSTRKGKQTTSRFAYGLINVSVVGTYTPRAKSRMKPLAPCHVDAAARADLRGIRTVLEPFPFEEFDSFQDFHEEWAAYCVSNFTSYRVRTSLTRRGKNAYVARFMASHGHVSLLTVCMHVGN